MSVVLEYPAPLRHRAFKWFLNKDTSSKPLTYAVNWAWFFGGSTSLFIVISNIAMYISFQNGDGTIGYHLWVYVLTAIFLVFSFGPLVIVNDAKVLPNYGERYYATVDFEKLNEANKQRYLPILNRMYQIGREHSDGYEALKERRDLINMALINQQNVCSFVDDDRSDIDAVKQIEKIYRDLELYGK